MAATFLSLHYHVVFSTKSRSPPWIEGRMVLQTLCRESFRVEFIQNLNLGFTLRSNPRLIAATPSESGPQNSRSVSVVM